MNRRVFLAGALMLGLVWATGAHAFMEEGTVRLGHVGILTGPGVDYGVQIVTGLKVALEEINQQGGVTVKGKPHKLDLRVYDSARDVAQAIALTRKLALSDQVLMIFGPVSSHEAVSVFGVFQRKLDDASDTGLRIPIMTTSAMRDGLGAVSPWAFRNATIERHLLANALPRVLKARGAIKTAAVIYHAWEDYGAAMLKGVYQPLLEQHGIKVVSVDGVHKGDRDYSPVVSKLARIKPDMLIMLARYDVGARTMIEAKRQGFQPRLVWASGMISQELINTGREAVEGLMMVSSYDASVPRAARVAEKFKAAAGVEMNEFGANSYEGMYLARWGIEHAKIENTPASLEQDRARVREALRQLQEFRGLMGGIHMGADDNDTVKEGVILTIADGKFKIWTP